MSGRHLAFPFRIGADGRSVAPRDVGEHVKGEVIQLLLTNPGERPFIPEFGGGLRRLVFEGLDDVTAAVAKATITQAVTRWLKERVELVALDVEQRDSTLRVGLEYRVVATGERQALSFEHEP